VLQAEVDAGELAREERPGEQAGPQRAVAVEQRHAARGAPQPQQHGGADHADRGLPHRRHFGHGRLDEDLLEAPERAARDEKADGEGVEMGLALDHSGSVTFDHGR